MSSGKQLILLCLLALFGAGLYFGWPHVTGSEDSAAPARQRPPAVVELSPVEQREMAETVEAVGTTRARQSVAIVPVDEGRVKELNFTPGQQVAKGDVLVTMDDTIERADLAEARARVTEWTQALDRTQTLLSTNAVSKATLEDTTARLAEARAQQDRAQEHLANRTVTAPFDGRVGLAEIDPGAWVASGQEITTLDDLHEVIVEFSLPETLFAAVSIGQSVSARSAAFPGRSFEGTISAVDSRIDPVSRAFRARAVIPNPDYLLPAGMFMSMTLVLSSSDATVVPEAAIVFEAAETYVFVAEGDTTRRTRVTTGQRRDGVISITGDVDPGAMVITRGLQKVRDGSAIRVLGADDGQAQ